MTGEKNYEGEETRKGRGMEVGKKKEKNLAARATTSQSSAFDKRSNR